MMHDEERGRAYELARLVAFAFHAPKKMPEFSSSAKKPEKSNQVDNERVRAYFIGLAMKGQ